MTIRIGYGYDVHRLESGRPLVLGGVDIGSELGPVAHSDGDVLLHALCDALLGAAALGDIGRHFPDTSDEFRGISSVVLLERVTGLIAGNGWRIGNIDATILLERPKVAPFREAMCRRISEATGVPVEAVSIKATTSEGLGFVGHGDGIAAHAVVLLLSERA